MLLYITKIDLAFSSAVQQSKRLRQNSFLQADDKMFFTSLEKAEWIFDFPFTPTTYPNRRNGVETVPPS
ncbi:hypothetical protein B0A48_08424 [Cryoendolithus antarcticus]|uniref:Uncharacterized protein n=1 Tax=Cryoendolithus antarcticus TaxID=1507870 RepID=A0A1V8T5E9_9PEZI|nr:hypothetical protein B0A48_08424 [Cryoendolithus antarcticus]